MMLEEEVSIQNNLQLIVDLEDDLLTLANPPCSDNLMNDTSDAERQDEVQIDDSVSNVSNISNITADDRVGFESKEGSSFDENSLSEEVVEVCDAACQTEFTDSDTVSNQSNSVSNDLTMESVTVRMATNSVDRNLHKRESVEAFLNATLQGALLRKPDGASDPSLHKELLSPTVDCKQSDPLPVQMSSTLPRNTQRTASPKAPNDVQTIKLQPYLFSPKHLANQATAATPPIVNDVAQPTSVSEPAVSKLKKLFRQHSSDSFENNGAGKNSSKKSKGSKLPGLRFSSKPRDSKPITNTPPTPSKKSEPVKKVNETT